MGGGTLLLFYTCLFLAIADLSVITYEMWDAHAGRGPLDNKDGRCCEETD